MIKLTYVDGRKVYLNPTYIESFNEESFNDPIEKETHIFCTGSVEFYRVKESPEEILTLIYNAGER